MFLWRLGRRRVGGLGCGVFESNPNILLVPVFGGAAAGDHVGGRVARGIENRDGGAFNLVDWNRDGTLEPAVLGSVASSDDFKICKTVLEQRS